MNLNIIWAQFAASALEGLCSRESKIAQIQGVEDLAALAAEFADALLAEYVRRESAELFAGVNR